jgi:hypothetical protein
MDKKNGMDSWMYNNPEAFNMGLGLLKGMEEDRRNSALSEAEVAKTQYGYLTGAGTGNVKNLKMNNSGDRVMQGAITGMTMKRDSDFQNKLFDAIAAKKGSAPYSQPNTVNGLDNQTEQNPILVDSANKGELSGPEYRSSQIDEALQGMGVAPKDNYVMSGSGAEDAMPGAFKLDNVRFPASAASTNDPYAAQRVASEKKAMQEKHERLMNQYGGRSRGY